MYLLDSFHKKKHLFRMIHLLGLMTLTAILLSENKGIGAESNTEDISTVLKWESLPDLPESLGVAGPFAGSHKDALIIAGGANFAKPIWATEKQWTQQIHVLAKKEDSYTWHDGGLLKKPIAYGASVTTENGIVCMGGNDGSQTFRDVFLLQWDPKGKKTKTVTYPALPEPCAYGQAALVGNTIYLAGGQNGPDLDSTMKNFWSLDLSNENIPEDFQWEKLKAWPGESRAFNITVAQHNGYDDCIYVISGRREFEGAAQFLKDVWEFTPRTKTWRSRAALPRCVMAGTGIAIGHSHIFVLGGADGSLFFKADDLKDAHPGFPKEALTYHTITDTWTSAGTMPANHVTTTALKWGSRIIIPSGEVRPRVRSPKIWSIAPESTRKGFGAVNYTILIAYLLLMIGIGFYFNRKNKNTDDYFRGGSQIPWWAAGCSIFATMLSSLTFTGLPSKAFAQDWVYAMGNMMIPVVAILAVYIALPLYRKLDVTSAYEYLENRFSRGVRLFGSASFTLFHIFRM
ncbi:MAG: sodium:solute symporter, partial [Limisphaerales bacterium]